MGEMAYYRNNNYNTKLLFLEILEENDKRQLTKRATHLSQVVGLLRSQRRMRKLESLFSYFTFPIACHRNSGHIVIINRGWYHLYIFFDNRQKGLDQVENKRPLRTEKTILFLLPNPRCTIKITVRARFNGYCPRPHSNLNILLFLFLKSHLVWNIPGTMPSWGRSLRLNGNALYLCAW